MATNKLNAELKSLIQSRQHEFSSIQILYDLTVQATANESVLPNFRARFKRIEKVRENFIDVNSRINEIEITLNEDAELDNQKLGAFDALYYKVLEFAETLPVPDAKTDKNTTIKVQLPNISVPKFDGNVDHWQTFKDSYVPLIHQNKSLSKTEKFHYLVSYLSGFALTIVKGLPITEQNYDVVFKLLLDRFDNKRTLATAYLDKIFKLQSTSKQSVTSLTITTNTAYECVNALRALQIDELSEFLLFYVVNRNIDTDTRRQFELQNKDELPKVDSLLSFLQSYIQALEVSQSTSTSDQNSTNKQTRSNKNPISKQKTSLVTSAPAVSHSKCIEQKICPCCNDNTHSIYKCGRLQRMDVVSRRKLISELKLCFNCLRAGHDYKTCSSKISCMLCSSKHNTLLHIDKTQTPSNSGEETPSTSLTTSVKSNAERSSTSVKILGSAVVRLRHPDGSIQCARALTDSCSMDCFITSACARRLGLPIKKCNLTVAGLGQNNVNNIKGVTFCTVMPRKNDKVKFDIPLIVLSKITSMMPCTSLPSSVRDNYSHLDLADERFHVASPVDLLLGVECFDQIYTGARFSPGPGLPCALSSVFGWIICGQFSHNVENNMSQSVTSLVASTCALDDLVKRFWEVEEPPTALAINPEDDVCERMYQDGTCRTPDGRYVVPLMLKDDVPDLGHSHKQSLNRLLNLEKRLVRDPQLQSEYSKFMREYEELGHMQPSTASSIERITNVIPHHCVLRPDSSTTRLRVVFDASSKTSSGKSLNDVVHVGPKLQIDIVDLVTKFRLHTIVFTADICKMYRQILIRPEDRSYQHILWRAQPNAPLTEYELNTVTYGVSSSPYLAIRTLRQLADDHGSEFPSRAAEVLRDETFMDDITTGCSSLNEAIQLKNDLVSLLAKGKFELRKWSSNCGPLLEDVPVEHCQTSKTFDESHQEFVRILGIRWDPASDCFSYSYTVKFEIDRLDKRSVLSVVSRIFDPLGWISPVVFTAKLLLQEMWRLDLGWDEKIPPHLAKQWHVIAANLNDLQEVRLPRVVLPPNLVQIHLVGFCDGSSKGFGCCVYLCAIGPNENSTRLLIGKSKVASLKPTTVNRLELCAAVLLAKVLNHMFQLLNKKIDIASVRAYTDSSTTLAWLNTPPHLLKTYVANRVVQATDLVGVDSWNHVSTHDNPADCSSRGTTCMELVTHPLWWSGPSWLSQPTSEWPTKSSTSLQEDVPEMKPQVDHSFVSVQSDDILSSLTSRRSSFTTIVRTLAWCLRFIKNSKAKKEDRVLSSLSSGELNNSLVMLVKHTQQTHFKDELTQVTQELSCPKPIQKLSPILDGDGILRVGGRIDNANLSMSRLHPILLPKSCPLSRLIVESYHGIYLHCGPRTLQSLIQRKFWILGVRLLVRTVVSKCVKCFKVKPIPCQPLMGKLPASRLQPGRCFHATGIDFGGPFTLKESRRRNARTYKAYICLFVCMSTKAVHIELVTELSSDAFLAALDRFVSRRGLCTAIRTDCGTNFVGANRHLKEITDILKSQYPDISDGLASRQIKWEFNPPSAPHFGGIFESGIKSVKFHLKRVIGLQALTFEEMSTVLSKTEAILNSRPLCSLSPDPSESNVLTPGHFLVGGPLTALPEMQIDENVSPRSRWHMLQKMTQSFWRVWQRDYLHTLQQKSKWFTGRNDRVKINDLVILIEPNLPTMCWKLGQIVHLHPGRDNVTRVVTVRTANGHTFRRPVVKICPLPL